MAKKRAKSINGMATPKNLRGTARMSGDVVVPKPTLGLGALAAGEGAIAETLHLSGRVVRWQSVRCSCSGENEHCFKCDGTGYFQRELAAGVDVTHLDIPNLASKGLLKPGVESAYSKDSRGGDIYSIREAGRFASSPLRDDHDE